MKKFLSITLVVLVILSFGVFSLLIQSVKAAPGDYNVPEDYATIQAAIDAALADGGGIVNVDSGLYKEELFILWSDYLEVEEVSGLEVVGSGTDEIGGTIISGGISMLLVDYPLVIQGFRVLHDGTTTDGHCMQINDSGEWVSINDCFLSGEATEYGGGMQIINSSPTISDCEFSHCEAGKAGGGMYNRNSSPTISDCKFRRCVAGKAGGGMYNSNSSPQVLNCYFGGYNRAPMGGAMCNVENSTPLVDNCQFFDNRNLVLGLDLYGAAMYNSASSPTVVNCEFHGNFYTITDPYHDGYGGGMYNLNSSPRVINCGFNYNRIYSEAENCNGYGGAMCNENSSPVLTNCTFFNNKVYGSDAEGGGIYNCESSGPIVTNCIFWDNFPGQITGGSEGLTVTYSDVEYGYPGEGNIPDNPLIIDVIHLSPDSPCIDVGINSALYLHDTDFEGDPRIYNGTVDMGADEFVPHIEIIVDIKPNSCPNPINVKSKGVLTVAILGIDEDLDVTQIDPASVELFMVGTDPFDNPVPALRSVLEDVATPYAEVDCGNEDACTDEGPDGHIDLTLKFDKQVLVQEIIDTLGGVSNGQVVCITLKGKLLDGTAFEGQDVVRIIKKGK